MANNNIATKSSKSEKIDAQNILSFLIDLIAVVILISIVNFFVVSVFGFSESALMEKGIETSVLERKLEIFDYISITYFAFLLAYLIFGRKYFSLGDKALNRK